MLREVGGMPWRPDNMGQDDTSSVCETIDVHGELSLFLRLRRKGMAAVYPSHRCGAAAKGSRRGTSCATCPDDGWTP